jgi:DNA-binding beta-propeller fold protein YncE
VSARLVPAAVALAGAVAAFALSPPAAAQDRHLLYVCIQDDAKVAIVDMDARRVDRILDLTAMGFSPTAKPHYVAVEPDGSYWYVSLIGENRVLKIDRRDRVVGSFDMGTPGMMALTADGHLAVSRSMTAVNPPSRIGLIDRATMDGEEVEVLFPRPHPMVVAGEYAYTGSLGVNQIAAVSIADARARVTNIDGPMHSLVQFDVSPDGRTLVASTDLSGQLLLFDLADPARPALTRSIPVGKMAFDPSYTVDGRHVWVPVKSTNEIAVFDASTWTEVARIRDAALKQPHQIIFSADGATAFVSTNNKMMMADAAMAHEPAPASLVIVDVASRQVVQSIELGHYLTGMGSR